MVDRVIRAVAAVPTKTSKRPGIPQQTYSVLVIGLWAATVVLSAVMIFGDLDRFTIGILTILLLLALMAAALPIGFAMIIAGGVALYSLRGIRVVESSLATMTYTGVASWSLSVLPMFIVMGVALWRSGLASNAYTAAQYWFGRMPAGLAVGTTFAGAGLASASGSTIGISLALGKMAIPEMMRLGYNTRLATGAVAMSGSLGQVIPPSILLVLYAGVAQTPVGPQLLAGIVPGLLLAAGFALVATVWGLVKPSHAPRRVEKVPLSQKLRSLIGVIPIAVIVLVIIGGMLAGIFTPTEAAAIGALIAIVLGWLNLGRGNRGFKATLAFINSTTKESVVSVASLFVLLIGALMIGRAITVSGVAQGLAKTLVGLDLGRVELLLLLILVYIVLGMFLESLPMILLTVPLLQVPLEAVGVDMIWFGVFLIIMCEIGMVFPPVGLLTFIVHRIAQDPRVNLGRKVTLSDVFIGIMPFVAIALVITIVLILWPEIVLWLPEALVAR
ncbi:TRAP transporter large permease [Arthrobacter sp. P2b]|uniref:TRAP transporter large permease n=1 Tax=Arthrobacter sp. P2b TaxID=1938741 RepID=UPI0009A58CE7|nr:TRAP transporter large permease [Arthrobacter sp. P2b]SLK16469.1 TRAP transporter, DctM subunit [Arthrobacter sp. P2b]